jgi:hypothetical protein
MYPKEKSKNSEYSKYLKIQKYSKYCTSGKDEVGDDQRCPAMVWWLIKGTVAPV